MLIYWHPRKIGYGEMFGYGKNCGMAVTQTHTARSRTNELTCVMSFYKSRSWFRSPEKRKENHVINICHIWSHVLKHLVSTNNRNCHNLWNRRFRLQRPVISSRCNWSVYGAYTMARIWHIILSHCGSRYRWYVEKKFMKQLVFLRKLWWSNPLCLW